MYISIFFIFFFSSRRRHTRLQGDWSSDVCSSDLDTSKLLTPSRTTFGMYLPLSTRNTIPRRPPPRCPPRNPPPPPCEPPACGQIGRASCRERVWVAVAAGGVKKKTPQ